MSEKKRGPGNPAFYKGMKPLAKSPGRPKGSVNKYTVLAREMMTERGPMIVEKIIDMALDGDVHCMKMCIDRILPVHKAVDPNKAKQQSQVVINVGASTEIQEKIANTDPKKIVNPKIKSDEEVIIEMSETNG